MALSWIKIKWQSSNEFVRIDLDNPEEAAKVTWTIDTSKDGNDTEDGGNTFAYAVSAEKANPPPFGRVGIVLHYKPEDQTPETQAWNESWGTSTITWIAGASDKKIEVVWRNADALSTGKQEITTADIISGQRGIRELEVYMRIARPQQAALRKHLLAIDGRCVISGETIPQALEAAHIRAASKNGVEEIHNAVLLRADLHRLFDAGLIYFEVSESEAILHFSEQFPSETLYKTLSRKALCSETFTRVKAALDEVQIARDEAKEQSF